MAKKEKGLFNQLTRLFRSGPVVKKNILKNRGRDFKTSSAFEQFRKNQSQVYSAAMSAYGAYDRMARYSDFSEMEYTPEIASALDIYSEESVSPDENGKTLHIYSENSNIKKILTELFYDTLNIEFNLTSWVRSLVKYGDFFLFNDVHPEQGVINAYPLPISEIEREEGFDPNDPLAVRFRWVTQGNQVLENWQVSHMRLLGNDAFLPYGSSVLEPARRIWRQLILLEDAMMVMRIVRAPSRKAFYIDVGNVPPEDIPNYMEQAQNALKKSSVVDKNTGRVDLRYNPLSIDEDYFIPVRGGDTGTKIEDVGGITTSGETDDVEYIQKKLFAALKIPKAYLGYDEGLGAKATLSQEDIRFSRTIARVQRTILSEMNKIAIVHLYCNGFSDEDLIDFSLRLSNPSTLAQQQKLELYKSRFEAAGTALTTAGLVSREWVQKNILRLSDEEIFSIKKGLFSDKKQDLEVEATQIETIEGPEGDPGGMMPGLDLSGGGMGPPGGGPPDMGGPPPDPMGGAGGGGASPLDLALSEKNKMSIDDTDAPIRAYNKIKSIQNILNESTDDKENKKTEFEQWQEKETKKKKDKSDKKRKYARKNHLFADNHVSEYQRTRKRNKDPMYGVQNDISSGIKYKAEKLLPEENENMFNIDEYLDKQIIHNAKITTEVKNILSKIDEKTKDIKISEILIHQEEKNET